MDDSDDGDAIRTIAALELEDGAISRRVPSGSNKRTKGSKPTRFDRMQDEDEAPPAKRADDQATNDDRSSMRACRRLPEALLILVCALVILGSVSIRLLTMGPPQSDVDQTATSRCTPSPPPKPPPASRHHP